ncbi:MAG: L,D-transpeptidase [Bacteroidales bacterium]|nr:L,D-transpeptidase [Bacteroidales bacterium]
MKQNIFKRFTRPISISLLFGLGLLILAVFSLFYLPAIQNRWFQYQVSQHVKPDSLENNTLVLKGLKKDIVQLKNKMDRLIPGDTYLIINTTDNSFKLFKNKKLIRVGICSTGSLTQLESGDEKKWLFETPKGVFRVQGKLVNPVWKKPDWAFAEEGLPIPSPNDPSRFEYGVLGDYALSIGNGYLIHGTLYQRFLGLAVTHGCVRLNDADLEYIYNAMPIGAKVFIY